MIDDKLARGMMRRYMRELEEASVALIKVVRRKGSSRMLSWADRVRWLDNVLDVQFERYVISKLFLADGKRSLLEALLIVPVRGEMNRAAGAFVSSVLRMHPRDGFSMAPTPLSASFHWTMRVFKRRHAYDPHFLRQELRATLIGLDGLNAWDSRNAVVPSVTGANLVLLKEGMIKTITYMSDAQASEEQEESWRAQRAAICATLGFPDWRAFAALTAQPSWIGTVKGGDIRLEPKSGRGHAAGGLSAETASDWLRRAAPRIHVAQVGALGLAIG